METNQAEIRERVNECGWGRNAEIKEFISFMDGADEVLYEIKNCARGCATSCYTYKELAECLAKMANQLQYVATNLESYADSYDNQDTLNTIQAIEDEKRLEEEDE